MTDAVKKRRKFGVPGVPLESGDHTWALCVSQACQIAQTRAPEYVLAGRSVQ